MRKEQLAIGVMLALLVVMFVFESYLLLYGDEYHLAMARAHVAMAPGLFGVGWSLVLFIAVAILLLYNLSRINLREDAISVLKTRYAKGEISREEYLEKLKDMLTVDHPANAN